MKSNFKKLDSAEMKNVLGGNAPETKGCVVYSISGSGANTQRVAYGTAPNATEANALAANMATTYGSRFGYDCTGTVSTTPA